MIQYRTIGRTGIKVSNLCFGTMSFGGNADENTSIKMYQCCREAGINFFDTADVYNGGQAEKILGKCIADSREEVVIATKVFYPTGKGVNSKGLSRRHIMQAAEASLKRLNTDYIDFYFVHSFDEETSMEETIRALDDLQHQGKILYPAVSNWAAWQMAKALGISARECLARFELIQPMYNLVKRQAETEIFPFAQSEQLGVISYSPLGAGLLTGKYGVGKKPEQGRIIEEARYRDRYRYESDYQTADRLTEYAEKLGISPATLAIAWVMGHPAVTAPIIGARNLEQLKDSLAAAEFKLSGDMREILSWFSRVPEPATDRTEVLLPGWT